MTQTITRNMTNEELMEWVEQAPTAEEQQERAEHANAGYPVMIDEEVKGEEVRPTAELEKIVAEQHAATLKDSPKHARQARLQIVRKDAKGNALTAEQVAAMDAKAAVRAAAVAATVKADEAKVATMPKAPKAATPKAPKVVAPKPEKVAKVAEPVMGRWHGVTFTLQMVLDVHKDARDGMSLEAINAKYGLDITDILKSKAWFVQRAAKVAKDCGIEGYVFPEAFLKPGRAAKTVVKEAVVEDTSGVAPVVEETPSQEV